MTNITRRQLALGGAGALALNAGFGLGGCATTAPAAAPGVAFDIDQHVEPELRTMARAFQKLRSMPLAMETLATSRKTQLVSRPLPQPQWQERTIPGPQGAPEVRIYIVNAAPNEPPRPAILYIHGGGYVMGEAKASLRAQQEYAQALNCVVVSVDYRLAPETPFPGSLEDNYTALKWVYDNAAELGIDRSKIAVVGESAGGGHAAVLAIAARDRGEVPLIFQTLIYPMLDDRTGSTRAVPPHIGALVWTAQQNRFGWSSLLGVPAGSRRVPTSAVPARIENLRGLPPTFIGVGSIDLFVSEDIQYAQRLIEAGVLTELNIVPGAFHGFDIIVPKATVSVQFKAAVRGALARAFERV